VLFPLWWAFSSSLKGVKELYGVDPTLWPAHPSLANYVGTLFDMSKFDLVEQMRNSVVVTGGTVLLTALLATLAGYGFARIRFRGRDLIFIIFLLSLFIPQSGGLMAAYELMSFLHLRNSLLGLILAFSSSLTVPVFIMRQSFQALPNELDDAARIDGATRWQFFWRVGVPLVSAGMTVVCIFTFISAWGEYLFTYTMEDTQSLYTLAVAVAQTEIPNAAFVDVPAFSAYGASAAIAIMAAVPALAIFILLQKWFVRGLAEGALKF
jgi:multiple sugar transport system permease protein